MIMRLWRGWTTADNAPRYAAHVARQRPTIAANRGYRGLTLLQRDAGEEVEFVTLTYFETMDDVRAFAGDKYQRAVIPPHLQETIKRACDEVEHYEVASTDLGLDGGVNRPA